MSLIIFIILLLIIIIIIFEQIYCIVCVYSQYQEYCAGRGYPVARGHQVNYSSNIHNVKFSYLKYFAIFSQHLRNLMVVLHLIRTKQLLYYLQVPQVEYRSERCFLSGTTRVTNDSGATNSSSISVVQSSVPTGQNEVSIISEVNFDY